METDEEELDTHICLACQLPIIGLENYVYHKKRECSAKKHKQSTVTSQGFSHGHVTTTQHTDLTTSLHNNLQSMGHMSQSLGGLQLEGQLSPAACQAISLFTKSPPTTTVTSLQSSTPGRYNVVDPNMVLDTMSLPTDHSLSTSLATDTLPVSSLNNNLTTSTPSIMDFLSTLELQCRPQVSPGKVESGSGDALQAIDDHSVNLEPRVPDGLKLANLLNDLNFDSDSEGFDMPSDAEDLLNFTDEDYRELGNAYVTGSAGGKGKGHGEGKGHGKGKTKGKGEYFHPGKNKKVSFPGKWRPGERIGGKLVSTGRWSSIGKRHYEDMSSDEDNTDVAPDGSTDVIDGDMSLMDEGGNISQTRVPPSDDHTDFSPDTQTPHSRTITVETIDSMEATAVDVLLQIKSEVRDSVPDHTYDGSEAPVEGQDHTYDATVSDEGTVTLLRCDPCNRLFRSSLALHSHMRSSQHKAVSAGQPIIKNLDKVSRQFQAECSGCHRSFNNKYNYARHLVSALHLKRSKSTLLHLDPAFQRLLLPLKLFQCRICPFYCNRHSDLLEHMSTEGHNDKLDGLVGPMMCTRCKYSSRSPRDVYKHFVSKGHDKMIQSSERPCILREVRHTLPCVHCGKIFHSATKLQQHCSVQHPIKKEKCKGVERQTYCEVCAKTFSSHYNWLQHHRRKHVENDENLHCEICNTKSFADRSYLDHHYKSRKHLDAVLKASAVNGILELNTMATGGIGRSRGRPSGSRGRRPGNLGKNRPPHSKGEGNKLYKCKECDYSTTVYTELRPHYIEVHSKNVVYDFMCDTCGFGFDSEVKLDKHQQSQRHRKMESEAEAAEHQAIVCQTCAHKFYSQDRYSLHMLTHKAAEQTTEQERSISRKLRGVPEKYHKFVKKVPSGHSKDIQCPECKEWCKSNNIVAHIRGQHGDRGNMPYKCTFCPKTFPSNASLYRHHKAHLGMKSFTCKICPKGYRSKSDLETHELNAHGKELDVVAKLQCSFCGEQFMQRTRLNIHMKKRHEKEREFPCTWPGCHRQFIFHSEYMTHFRVHTGERPYLCDLCGFATKTKVQLRRHEKSHTGESNYKCKYCTYSASHSWGLRRHMRIHSGVKPYQCPHCDYRCNCHTNLRHHIITSKRHPGMCLYHCKHCGFATNKGVEFQQHSVLKHSVQRELVENVAEYCGVYFPQEDTRDVLEGSQVLPVAERKPRTKKKPQVHPQKLGEINLFVAPGARIRQNDNYVYTQQEEAIEQSNATYDFQPDLKSEVMRSEVIESDEVRQHVVVHQGHVEATSHHETVYIPRVVTNHEVVHGDHEVIIGNHDVVHQDVLNQEVGSHAGQEVEQHVPLTSELTHLIAPHMEGLEQGTVVELHLDEDYAVASSRHGHTVHMVSTDNKPMQFYYL